MPEHQPRDVAKEREGEVLGRCLGTAELHLTPCHFLGAKHSHVPARAVDEVLWRTKQSNRNRGEFLSLEKRFEE